MERKQITISVNNTEYSLRADVDSEVLMGAVHELNDRIARYKNRTNKDELRATIMAALSIATEHYYNAQKVKTLQDELDMAEMALEDLHKSIDAAMEKL